MYMTMTQNFYMIISLLQDSEYYNSMCYIRDNDPEPLDLYFAIEEDYFGEVSRIFLLLHVTV